MGENRACTNFRPSFPAEGAPVYEQKGAASATEECREARFLRMTRAERATIYNANVQPEHRLQTNRAGTDLAGNLCSVGAHLQNSRAAAGSAYGALLQMAHVKRATTRQPKDL